MHHAPFLAFGDVITSFLTGSVWPWLLVVFGIGLVVFVHEMGHFWAAKFCGVRVDVFSLGFGPRLGGFRRGETDYRLSLVPLGGYVKMHGDTPGEETGSDPRALGNKTVSQRLLIYSGGVIMNMVFAICVFPLAFQAGVPFNAPIIGSLSPGGAAWNAGLQSGDEIVKVGDNEIYSFNDLRTEIALGDVDGIEFQVKRPGVDGILNVTMIPDWDAANGRYDGGIGPAYDRVLDVTENGAASSAGLSSQDTVVAVNSKRIINGNQLIEMLNDSDHLTLTVDRAGKEQDIVIVGRDPETPPHRIGIRSVANEIIGIRGAMTKLAWERKDRIIKVDDRIIHDESDWRKAIESARSDKIRIELDRGGMPSELLIEIADKNRLLDDIALGQYLTGTEVLVEVDSPAFHAGLRDGSRILSVNSARVSSFEEIQESIQKTEQGSTMSLEFLPLNDSGETSVKKVSLAAVPLPASKEFGLMFSASQITRQYGLTGACQAGWRSSLYWTKSTYLTLKKMLIGDVSTKNLGGIITIGYVSRSFADSGLAKLFFFLAILSINLAFVNLLPIPVLDGGHILFLLVEKLKGSPVSDRVLGYSQVLGFVFILALLLYVTYNDIVRLLEIG